MARPTEEAYGEFQRAYDFYNDALFENTLPPCLITLQRKGKRTLGYFCHKKFVRLQDGRVTTDEIAMNPIHFTGRSVEDTLSTLAHEMVHVWEAHHGKPGRRGYHNKAWAAKMKQVGLYPSDTGAPGGKEIGQRMSHYIVADGNFAQATARLMKKGFAISWADAEAALEDDGDPKKKPKKSGVRVKYTCPSCENHVWGRAGLHIVCSDCDAVFIGEQNEGEDEEGEE